MQFSRIQITIKGKVLWHLKNYVFGQRIFHVFSSQSAWREFSQEGCGVSLHLRGKPLNQDQGISKLVFVMDSKTDELMGVGMKGA